MEEHFPEKETVPDSTSGIRNQIGASQVPHTILPVSNYFGTATERVTSVQLASPPIVGSNPISPSIWGRVYKTLSQPFFPNFWSDQGAASIFATAP
jgi:hypothetical protein